MPEFGLLMSVDPALHRLRWYGEGPDESYVDRRSGALLGIYESDVADELTPYLRPQECANHTGVRWITVLDDAGAGLRLESVPGGSGPTGGLEISALPWTPFELESAAHPSDLPASNRTVLRPAWMRRGVGGDDSWGSQTHPEYRLPAGVPLRFQFAFQGVIG